MNAFKQKIKETFEKEYSQEIKIIREVTFAFIAKYKRILYGQTAIKALVEVKGYEPKLPATLSGIDISSNGGANNENTITFYSPNSQEDARKIFYELKTHPKLTCLTGFYSKKETNYDISISISQLGRVVYIRFVPFGYDKIDYSLVRNNIRSTTPELTKVWIFNVLTDPILKGKEWKIYFLYLLLINKFYPHVPIGSSKPEAPKNNTLFSLLKSERLRKNVIYIGRFACNYAEFGKIEPNEAVEVLSTNTKKVTKEIMSHIHGLRYQAQPGHDDFIKARIDFFDKKNANPVLSVYSIEGFCIPVYKSPEGLLFGTYHTLLKYLYLNKENHHLIKKLNKIRINFLNENKLLGIEKESGIYRILQIDCLGTRMSELRDYRLKVQEGKVKPWILV